VLHGQEFGVVAPFSLKGFKLIVTIVQVHVRDFVGVILGALIFSSWMKSLTGRAILIYIDVSV
jgi:general stress protein CsbA